MNIKRFFGKNSREALSMVRKALGEDAVILSNRTVNGGNEIMAFKEEDMNAMVSNGADQSNAGDYQDSASYASSPTPSYESSEPTTLLSLLNKNNRTQAAEFNNSESFNRRAGGARLDNTRTDNFKLDKYTEAGIQTAPVHLSSSQVTPQQASQQMADMLNEMRNMRSVIESQLTSISWGNIQQRDPIKSQVLSALLAAGFSAALSRALAEKLPANLDGEKAMTWIRAILAKNLNTIENETEVLDQGGIFALIGPTGVGKTTTTAKLAARYVMKHGTQKLGLITTDAYRVGGHEQLRIYGKILGVMVHAVKDEADLKIALNELKGKHTILIDTVGVSQRDRMVAEQIAMLSNTNAPIKKLLCLNATSTGETLTDVIKAYKGKGLDGCIITKLDEAATIGNTLDVIIREKLKLYYAANGQRVPEDIHLANKQQLIHHALRLNSASNLPFQFLDKELPFVMGNTVHAANSNQLTEISYV
ncbi:MAG TPA: flagellar biosynthesis protein FlhF [Methylophilaceae bacterium]|nr:flagellar biosynthesis protein FlhF [Methylophilaceae bacterium]